MSKIIIYQLLPRLFGNKVTKQTPHGTRKQNGVGKFEDINPKALSAIRDMGISHIWYTGIIEHALVEGYPKESIPDGNPQIIKGMAGSPYAIKDYYDVNPDLATHPKNRMKEFEALVARTHKAKLKVLIDFVPNHVAREYESDNKPEGVEDFGTSDNTSIDFSAQNDFYYLQKELFLPENSGTPTKKKGDPYEEYPAKATGNDKFHNYLNINDWYETVKLNYGINYYNQCSKHFDPTPSVWKKMKDILFFWASKGVDGFRCDMVEMVPVEFWEWVIPQLKEQYPDILFIAEVYNPNLYQTYTEQGQFDYLYDKVGLYDSLRNITQHGQAAACITNCWQSLQGLDPKMLRFLENHDEQRIASKHFLGNAKYAIPAMLLAATLHTGPLMIYAGQEVGESADGSTGYSGDDGRTSIFDYAHIPSLQKWVNNGKFNDQKLTPAQQSLRDFYQKLLLFTQKHTAITQGNFYDLMYANQDSEGLNPHYIYSYIRHNNNERLLFVLNFDRQAQSTFKLKIPAHTFEAMGITNTANLFAKEIFHEAPNYLKFTKDQIVNEGVEVTLKPNSFAVFQLNFGL